MFLKNYTSLFLSLFTLAFVIAFGLTACSDDKGSSTCCSKSECVDGVKLKCHLDLADLTIETCASGACDGIQCAISQCPGVEASTRCVPGSSGSYFVCDAGIEVQLACPSNRQCVDGICVPSSCTIGEKLCGFEALLVCDDGVEWRALECDAGQVCTDGGTEPACSDTICTPGDRGCQGDSATVCAPNGGTYDTQKCGSGKTCRAGQCIAEVCGKLPDVPDAGSNTLDGTANNDSSAIPDQLTILDIPRSKPELKPLSKASVKVNGESVVFTSGKDARWITLGGEGSSNPDAQALQIVMSKGGRKIEILLMGIQENQVGQWTDADVAEIQVEIRWSDGFTENGRADSGCSTVGWTSCALTYSVEISAFEAVGERVSGIFSGDLYDGTEMTEGSFEVERSQ